MRVGIANPFAWRPHVAHMVFLDRQLRRLGHNTFFLGCGGGLENCASQVGKAGVRKAMECAKCRAGSIRSYLNVEPARLDLPVRISAEDLERATQWTYSTACTTLQVEHERETQDADFRALQQSLRESTAKAYVNTRQWIRDNHLDCVFLFNGRFELTRAILEACVSEGVRFVSVERSWFGDGLQLLPQEGCLGLKTFLDFGARWADKPLTRPQAERASGMIGRRINRRSHGEWLQYNLNSRPADRQTIKYLFLPSSQHEWLGDSDRTFGWEHPVQGLEYLFNKVHVGFHDIVVRGHPVWSRRIKNYGANRASTFYREWCARVGAEYIDPSAEVDTHSLMRVADVVILNASSAALEAAWLGKPIICLVPAPYSSSGITANLFGPEQVDELGKEVLRALLYPAGTREERLAQCQRALRYLYCTNFRLMQFVDAVKATSPFSFHMMDPENLARLDSLVTQGVLMPDDPHHAAGDAEERLIASEIIDGNGDSIGVEADDSRSTVLGPLRRRLGYRLIDLLPT